MSAGGAHPLSPYPELLELCAVRGWRVHLDWGREGWSLDVFEAGDLIGRGVSNGEPPAVFRELAAGAAASLSRSGRVKP